MARLTDVYCELWRSVGGHPSVPERYRELLTVAGFERPSFGSTPWEAVDHEARLGIAEILWVAQLQNPEFISLMERHRPESVALRQMFIAAVREWAANADGHWSMDIISVLAEKR